MADFINIGAAPDDGSGDPARTVGTKINAVLPVRTVTASEDLTAGQLVNLHASSGLKMRKADADDTTKPAHGFVKDTIANGDSGFFYGPGLINDQLSGLTPGQTYYLSTTGGGEVTSVPSSSPNGQQIVGVAMSATELLFAPQPIIEAP